MSMRTIGTFLITSALVSAAALASACPNCKRGYVFGKPVAVGNGMAWTWAKLGATPNQIDSMGVTFTETALEGLPDLGELEDQSMPMAEFMLDLPKEVKGKPFDHVMLNWNPKGHDPFPLYGKPHFDIHFFTLTPAQAAKITGKGEDLKKCNKKPAPEFIPAGYILPPGTVVPKMGAHWIDPKSKEFNGKEFDTTFIYGSYDGKISFLEPMITTAYLASKPNYTEALAMPKKVDATGFYPSAYSIKHNEARREITVSLDGLKFVQAAKPKVGVAKK